MASSAPEKPSLADRDSVRALCSQAEHPGRPCAACCRLVVPLLGEDVTGPVEELELRTCGVMEVTVGEARGLHGGGGWLSSAHPQVG